MRLSCMLRSISIELLFSMVDLLWFSCPVLLMRLMSLVVLITPVAVPLEFLL